MGIYTIFASVVTVTCSLYVIFSIMRRNIESKLEDRIVKIEKEIQQMKNSA
ncbi:MAG: hypothetical protein KDK54_22790 [Leptospiraceae bacterium]|nr:hypothetical protein [Leptospiraceae bacterium]